MGARDNHYAFSEHVSATSLGRWHISPVGREGLKLGGGAPPPLCASFERWQGWHINLMVNARPRAIRFESVCQACATAFKKIVDDVDAETAEPRERNA